MQTVLSLRACRGHDIGARIYDIDQIVFRFTEREIAARRYSRILDGIDHAHQGCAQSGVGRHRDPSTELILTEAIGPAIGLFAIVVEEAVLVPVDKDGGDTSS
ncbi:MAG: hypothetical protein IPO87_17550 [Flavobacteriales bacterium]|nr:hypothetical protein [Flavobacteriales bacterium]